MAAFGFLESKFWDLRTVLYHSMNAGSLVGTLRGSRDAKTFSSYPLDSKEPPGETFKTFNFAVGGLIFFWIVLGRCLTAIGVCVHKQNPSLACKAELHECLFKARS